MSFFQFAFTVSLFFIPRQGIIVDQCAFPIHSLDQTLPDVYDSPGPLHSLSI